MCNRGYKSYVLTKKYMDEDQILYTRIITDCEKCPITTRTKRVTFTTMDKLFKEDMKKEFKENFNDYELSISSIENSED